MTTPTAPLAPGRLYIDGGWRSGEGLRRDVVNPATGKAVTTAADATDAEVDAAVEAARRAYDSGVWSGLSGRERSRVLYRAAALIQEHAEELAQLETLDTGKPIQFSRMIDVGNTVTHFEYYAGLAYSIDGATRQTGLPALAYTRHEPYGVVAAITPFNFPLILSTSKIAPALAAGNTVVHKPAEDTPLTALRLAELLTEAGLPAGVLNVVTGGGAVGSASSATPASTRWRSPAPPPSAARSPRRPRRRSSRPPSSWAASRPT
ncbi:hypothetical protein Prum_087100 [Phytohabitans rumicis]|uniref:Aldehyde dehydrogenase domain-containing protein n=1 Tax=Phytohabitans rumicis TaxID=1076125 RepID=A0A6V8LJL8_9ACTN|nr:hypothetical protein Prum_087100 [Phytohabitans rumicis]